MQQIEKFLTSGPVAMAGVSRNRKKFSTVAFRELRKKGLDLVPVNPNCDEIEGIKAWRNVKDIPADIRSLLIITPKTATEEVVKEAVERGFDNIWIQQMSDTPAAMAMLAGSEANIISGQCIMMFHQPTGIHKFHRAIKKFFGRLPS